MVKIRVPATTANMGPGFDTLGMALDIWNNLTVERSDRFEMVVKGEGEGKIPLDETNLICVALKAAFESAGKEVPPLKYTCENAIPFARGMGSSSAGIVSGALAGLTLSGHQLAVQGQEEFLQIAAELEGHADNVAPAIYGGCQLGCWSDAFADDDASGKGRWFSSRVNISHGLQCILFIPDFIAETKTVRKLLPEMYPKHEVVFNIQRMGVLINALSTGNLEELRIGTEDAMHQPYRAPAFKHMYPLIEAAKKAGAHGTYLSGAGPTILAITSGGAGDVFTQRDYERSELGVALAMEEEADKLGINGRFFITQPTQQGAYILNADPPFSSNRVSKFAPSSTLPV